MQDDERSELDPADIFSSSLEALFDYQPVSLASAGAIYTYTHESRTTADDKLVDQPLVITLLIPDTRPENWSLHASDIWAASHYLADHLNELKLDSQANNAEYSQPIQVLELGASAGLPGISIAKTHRRVSVIVSDYPDELLIKTLRENVVRNGVSERCRVVPYSWGSDPSPLISQSAGFDTVVAADTLWNPSLHAPFIQSLQLTLKRSPLARVHLVAGLHTGRYTIQSFLNAVQEAGFEVESVVEKLIKGLQEKLWSVASNEDEQERRRWVVWIILKWKGG